MGNRIPRLHSTKQCCDLWYRLPLKPIRETWTLNTSHRWIKVFLHKAADIQRRAVNKIVYQVIRAQPVQINETMVQRLNDPMKQ